MSFDRFRSFFIAPILTLLPLIAVLIMLSGCEMGNNQLKMDRAGDMEMQNYRDGLAPRSEEEYYGETANADMEAGLPEFMPYVAEVPVDIKPMPLVTASLNQTIPLRDALFELARQADYDIELDPRISGSVIFTARNKPFDVVIGRISEIAGLRYKFVDDVVRVELDTPYQKLYKVDYLNYIRTTKSTISNNVAVVTGDGADTGSDFEAKGESEANFWGELQAGLDQILGGDARAAQMRTAETPEMTATSRTPPPVETVPATDGAEVSSATAQQPQQAILNIESLPVTDEEATEAEETESVYSVNKQAGMISVFATEKKHKQVAEYLRVLKRVSTAQVLIEAKILQVDLSDQYATGIDWDTIRSRLLPRLDIEFPQPAIGDLQSGSGFSLAVGGSSINAVLDAVSHYGTVRALASPRMTVLNNQSAVLNVATNVVYFDVDVDVTRDEFGTQTEVDTEIKNVPEGVLINVMPAIDLDNNSVMMSLRPTVTRVSQFKNDPGSAYIIAQAGLDLEPSQVPEVDVQEFDSVIRVNSGEAVLMGGLMKDRVEATRDGIPVLSEVPLVGGLFRNHTDEVLKSELIVFLKATIVDGESTIDRTDRQLYKNFAGDRRPLKL